ncbi:MAG: hypothetical protein J6U40_02810 [Kiritimatiellae bacterium]|nr:hypothetical protein [Kiritimatiellia bacterium]MBP5320441.1 hypothetical protein [Kiritimatiellia bacterium]
MRTVWKIGCRWDELGRQGTSIFEDVFIPAGFVFAYTGNCANIREGDLIVVADGFQVIAIAEALTPGCSLVQFDSSKLPVAAHDYFSDPKCFGCKVRFFLLDENDTFTYKKIGMFCQAPSIADHVRNIYETMAAKSGMREWRLNLFGWANKELAQDSFLCWLFSHANTSPNGDLNPLRDVALDFICRLLAKCGVEVKPEDVDNVIVDKQILQVDLAVRFTIAGVKHALMIEDKVNAKVYNDIEGYKKRLAGTEHYADRDIHPILIRTGDESSLGTDKPIPKFLREDFLRLLERHKSVCEGSEILSDFAEHLRASEANILRYLESTVEEWNDACWIGFYREMQNRSDGVALNWTYVPNAKGGFWCLCPVWTNEVWVDSFAFYWHMESDKRQLVLKVLEVYANHSAVRNRIVAELDRFLDENEEWQNLGMTRPERFGCGYSMTLKVISSKTWFKNNDGRIDLDAVCEFFKRVFAFRDAFVAYWKTNATFGEKMRQLAKK